MKAKNNFDASLKNRDVSALFVCLMLLALTISSRSVCLAQNVTAVPLYRFLNATWEWNYEKGKSRWIQINRHFYTSSEEERKQATNRRLSPEGIACYVLPKQVRGTVPLYRLKRKNVEEYFYTISESSKQGAISQYGYRLDGIVGYVSESQTEGTTPFYRLYKTATPETLDDHFYTASAEGKDEAIDRFRYTFEGIEGYVWTKPETLNPYGEIVKRTLATPSNEPPYTKEDQRTDMIHEVYQAVFGRSANDGDLNYWRPRYEDYFQLMEANRAWLFSPAGAQDLEETVTRALQYRFNFWTKEQFNVLRAKAIANKWSWQEMVANMDIALGIKRRKDLPDLRLSSYYLSPDKNRLILNIRNSCNVPTSGDFSIIIEIFQGIQPNPQKRLAAEVVRVNSPIASGASTEVPFDISKIALGNDIRGKHLIMVEVDTGDYIKEADEKNNIYSIKSADQVVNTVSPCPLIPVRAVRE